MWRVPRRGPVVQSPKFWGALVLNPADDRLPVDSHTLLHGLQNEQQTGIFLRRHVEAATQLIVQPTLINVEPRITDLSVLQMSPSLCCNISDELSIKEMSQHPTISHVDQQMSASI